MFLFEHKLHLGRRLDSKAAFLLWLIHCLCSAHCLFLFLLLCFVQGDCVWSLFCYALLSIISSFASY